MRTIVASDYQLYRRWFERSLDLVWQMPATSAASTMAAAAKAEEASAAKAITSVSISIVDTIGMTDRFQKKDIESIDRAFEQDGLPTLSSMRALFSRKVKGILKSGKVDTDEEYYTLKALEDTDLGDSTLEEIRKLISEYELRSLPSALR